MKPIDFLIYGKIIVDEIDLRAGGTASGVLGGGGPQALFGGRLWHDSVGFLSRSGVDIEPEHVETLRDLDVDLSGWVKYSDIPTPRGQIFYDDNEYQVPSDEPDDTLLTGRKNWDKLLAQRLSLPERYQQPRAFHLITEFHDEPMVDEALRLQTAGTLFSLEPIIDYRTGSNRDQMLDLIRRVDIVSPDWPSASGIAGSQDRLEVMRFWSRLGPKMVTVRHGRYGSYAWDKKNSRFWHIPAVPVDVVDPTGAGNSYAAGAAVGWLLSQDVRVAATYGAISARFLVDRVGLPKIDGEIRAQAEALFAEHVARGLILSSHD